MSSSFSSNGADVTRKTANRLAERLAVKLLPQYEADDGPLTAAQLCQIKKAGPQNTQRSVHSSLLEAKTA